MATPKKDIPPKKTKEAKKPSIKSPPPKKTQQTKKPTTTKGKTPEKKKPNSAKKSTNINKITSNGNARESDAEAVSSPSSESRRGAEQNGGKITKTPTPKSKKGKEKGKRKRKREGEVAEEEEVKAYTFPMERVRRIIRSEDSDLRISNDAVFLINKATEKFLEKFCEESHACCVKDRRKAIAYKHLATVVSKRKRYDFLSDYVPEKVKAEDALAKRKLAEAKAG